MFIVYILFSQKLDKFYIGYTNNLERRLLEHNRNKGKFTDNGIPWQLVYKQSYASKSEAMAREKEIKARKSKAYIQQLIELG